MDGGKDGRVSVAEVIADRSNPVRKIGKDKDGAASRVEITARDEKNAGGDANNVGRVARPTQGYADANGRVEAQEPVAAATAEFKQRDENGDGYIIGAD